MPPLTPLPPPRPTSPPVRSLYCTAAATAFSGGIVGGGDGGSSGGGGGHPATVVVGHRSQRRRPRRCCRRRQRRRRVGVIRAGNPIAITRAEVAAVSRLFLVLFVRVRERVQHGTQHLGGPLGEGGVTRAGRLVAGLVAGLLVSVSVARVLLAEDAEERQEEGAEHQDKEAEDDCVLDGGGIEGERGGAVRGHCDVSQPRRPVLRLLLLLGDVKGADVRCENEGDSRHGVHPLHHDAAVVAGRGSSRLSIWGAGGKEERVRG